MLPTLHAVLEGLKVTLPQISDYSARGESLSKGNGGPVSESPLPSKPQCSFL